MRPLPFALFLVAAAGLTGCAGNAITWQRIDHGVAVLHPTQANQAHGTVHFVQQTDNVLVVFDIAGLEPDSTHGIHVHEYGDCTAPDATSAGGHYNPQGHPHELPPKTPRHAGDLGNIVADAKGRVRAQVKFDNISVSGMKSPVLARAVILHAKPDTGMGQTGEAGPRIACGVIGIANPQTRP